MPELPEVEALARAISPLVVGRMIESVKFYRSDLRIPIPIDLFDRLIVGRRIQFVKRRSKYLLLETEDGSVAIFHLGMSGFMESSASEAPQHKHTHASFKLSSKDDSGLESCRYIHYIDPRRFGIITCCSVDEVPHHRFFSHLGPEPLASTDLADHLFNVSRGKNVSIKNFVMNAAVVVGVGNIYASESLYKAGIRPTAVAGKLSLARYRKLAEAINETLNAAIACGGTTLRDFRKPSGEPGYFAVRLSVYGRAGESCHQCGGKIKQIRLSGRSSFFCPRCQR